jgi:probable rRNA maturation factor
VLSFHYYDDFAWLWEEDVAGEIVICEDILIEQAEQGSGQELYILTIHSILHILGYDHETDEQYEEMKKWEEMVWGEVFGKKSI